MHNHRKSYDKIVDRPNKILEWKAEAAMIYDKPKEILEYVKDKINQHEMNLGKLLHMHDHRKCY